jgi:hypothetical protein
LPKYIQGAGGPEVLPDGSEWSFVTEDATEKESNAGNPMIELKNRIIGPNGEKKALLFSYLVFTEGGARTIDEYREATGDKLEPGKEATLEAEDCIDRHGRLVVTTENWQGRERNKVSFYITDSVRATKMATRPAAVGVGKVAGVGKNRLGEPADMPF